ncbi:MAG: hypothetical protein K6U80_12185 [Firmicutes bacterium]|nr:hypothetical protein [Bacillota bacterium]
MSGTIQEVYQDLKIEDLLPVLVDPKQYQAKPTIKDTKRIAATILKRSVKYITVEKLAEFLLKGQSVYPGKFEGEGIIEDSTWRSQRVFMIDIDNDPDKVGDRIISVDGALDICRESGINPAFIFETFSSREYGYNLRFRIVFVTNSLIDSRQDRDAIFYFLFRVFTKDGIKLYDPKCFNPSRIFFGGKALLYIDHSARLDDTGIIQEVNGNPNIYINYTKLEKEGFCTNNKKSSFSYYGYENLQMVKNSDIKGLQSIFNSIPSSFLSFDKACQYLNCEVDLFQYLGIGNVQEHPKREFTCLFHEDQHPSANIIYPSSSGEYFYYCFGCETKGNIIGLTGRIRDCNRIDAAKFLLKVYRIAIDNPILKGLRENIGIIDAGARFESRPDLQILVNRYPKELIALHRYALKHVPFLPYKEDRTEMPFFMSLTQLAKEFRKKDIKTVSKIMELFTFLKLVRRIPDSEVPKDFIDRANEIRKGRGYKRTVQFYSLPVYDEDLLVQSQDRAKLFRDNCTMKGLSKEMIRRTFGDSIADEVYPKQRGEEPPERIQEFQDRVTKIIFNLIKDQGYATEADILKAIGRNSYSEHLLKVVIQETLDNYGLAKIRSNKTYKERLNIKGNGYPVIIIPDLEDSK